MVLLMFCYTRVDFDFLSLPWRSLKSFRLSHPSLLLSKGYGYANNAGISDSYFCSQDILAIHMITDYLYHRNQNVTGAYCGNTYGQHLAQCQKSWEVQVLLLSVSGIISFNSLGLSSCSPFLSISSSLFLHNGQDHESP